MAQEKPWRSPVGGWKGKVLMSLAWKCCSKRPHSPRKADIYHEYTEALGWKATFPPPHCCLHFPGQDLRDLWLSNSPKEMPRSECSSWIKAQTEADSQLQEGLPPGTGCGWSCPGLLLPLSSQSRARNSQG